MAAGSWQHNNHPAHVIQFFCRMTKLGWEQERERENQLRFFLGIFTGLCGVISLIATCRANHSRYESCRMNHKHAQKSNGATKHITQPSRPPPAASASSGWLPHTWKTECALLGCMVSSVTGIFFPYCYLHDSTTIKMLMVWIIGLQFLPKLSLLESTFLASLTIL